MKAPEGTLTLHNAESGGQIFWRAHKGAIIQIPDIEIETRNNRLDSLNERMEGEGKPQRAKRVPLQQLWRESSPR
jgi:hypothetical protein